MEEKIMSFLCEITGTDELSTNPDISLFKSGLLSSVDLIDLIVYLEEECGFDHISPAAIDRDKLDTPRQILEFTNNLATIES